MTPYRRKFFIKDLFSPRGLFNSFEHVQFASIEDYFVSLQQGWIDMGRNQKITIRVNDENLESLYTMFSQTGILTTDKMILDVTDLSDKSLLIPFLNLEGALDVLLNVDKIESIDELKNLANIFPQKWFESNRLVLDVFIDKDNYRNQLNSIVEIFMKTCTRFFCIHLDYESLSDLTFKEFELLLYLMKNKGIVVSRDKILEVVWGYACDIETRTVDVHIRTLRHKLGTDGDIIETVRGVGYRIAGE